ncbi:unnamed protein product [Urochloa humidicola]
MGSSSKRWDEELNEAMADDLPELRFPRDEEETKKDKAKKKRLYRLSPEDAEVLLSYKCQPYFDILDKLAQNEEYYTNLVGPQVYGGLRAGLSAAQDIMKHYENTILAVQEKIQHDLETKGFVTYEATDEIKLQMRTRPPQHLQHRGWPNDGDMEGAALGSASMLDGLTR